MASPVQTPSTKLQALQNLSKQMPVANQQRVQQQQAGQAIQMQQAVAAAPQTIQQQPAAQQVGAATAQQAATSLIDSAKQNLETQGQVAQAGQAVQAQQGQAEIASAQSGLKQQQMDGATRFAQLDSAAKKSLYDDTMQFQRDESNRALFNERQLMDYARLNAMEAEKLKYYQQNAQQVSAREIQALRQANDLILQKMENAYRQAKQRGDQETQIQISEAIRAQKEAMAEEEHKAQTRMSAGSTIGTVGGGVAGAIFGGPAGATAGAQVGGGLGTAAASVLK